MAGSTAKEDGEWQVVARRSGGEDEQRTTSREDK
jgi:hypothetical protein